MITGDIRSKSKPEILDEIKACKRELLNISFQWQEGETRSPARKKDIRRDIARMKTVLREMDFGINKHLSAKE